MLSEMRYRRRAWHSLVVEDQDGRMVAIADSPQVADLMAAAPDLLTAAKGALAALSQPATFPADIAAAKKWLTDAIAKAKVRS